MPQKNWVAVASADHARRGGEGGFIQVSHGKLAPLKRIAPGDRVAAYAPTVTMGGKDKCQAFILIGIVRAGEPYQMTMNEDFKPFRRDVEWTSRQETPIAPLLETLDFTKGRRNWGYQLRFGLFAISDHDIDAIAQAMGVALSNT
ncbi:MAG TPA: EVE domain-containing protein [Stellaceae bacterium]|nr:EVE domain-containing protein [Stellaceae bacterium]